MNPDIHMYSYKFHIISVSCSYTDMSINYNDSYLIKLCLYVPQNYFLPIPLITLSY